MAQYNAIKLNIDEDTVYGISNKTNTYIPQYGTFPTRRLALIKTHGLNVAHFNELSKKAWEDMLKLMDKEDDYEVDGYRYRDIGKGYSFYTERGDYLC